MKTGWLCVGLLVAALAAPAWAASGVMLRDEAMKASPSASAGSVGSARKGTQVDVLARKGGWTQVRSGSQTGWVRLLSVRSGAPSRPDAAADIAGVAAIGQARQPGKVVAVAGLRGLNEEELRAAKYDAAALQKLDSYAVGTPEAQRFATEGGLVRRQVAYLPSPKPASGSSRTAPRPAFGGE